MIRLLENCFVLWAIPAGEKIPFEVSREVDTPVQPKCKSSPFCPGERTMRVVGRSDSPRGRKSSQPTWEYDERFRFSRGDCPYSYKSKDECYREINRQSILAGCFPQADVRKAANLLKSLGYQVFAEEVSGRDLEGNRILIAHGPIYGFHDLRVEHGAGGFVFYMIRDPDKNEMPPGTTEL